MSFVNFQCHPAGVTVPAPVAASIGRDIGGRQLRLMPQGHGRTSVEHEYSSTSSCHSSRVSEQSGRGGVEIRPQKMSLEHPTRCNGPSRKGDQPNNWRAASQRPPGPVRFNLNFDEDVSEIGSHVACLLRAGVRGFRGDLRCLCLDVCRCVRDVCFPRFLVLFGMPVVVWDCLLFGILWVPSSERRRTLGHLGGTKYFWHFSLALQVFVPHVVASVLVFIALSVLIVIL